MTVAAVIKALGGTNRLAAELGVVPSAVRNWRRLDAFPKRLHMDIRRIARRRRVRLDDALFRELSAAERQARDAQQRLVRAVQVMVSRPPAAAQIETTRAV